jgi:hypothetical protein
MRKLVLFAGSFLLVSQAHGAVTVGQFIDRIASKRDLSSLSLDRNNVLTEGDMVMISVAFGINVTTQTPNKVVTEKQVDTYFSVFNYELHGERGDANPPPGDPPNGKAKGKGKSKGKHHSPSDPDDNDDDDDDD